MILNIILTLTIVASLASIINLFETKKSDKKLPMKVKMPGNLPIVAFSTEEGKVLNFIIDSGSNISHICSEYFNDLNTKEVHVHKDGTVTGLGAVNTGITTCNTILTDPYGRRYSITLSVSEQLSEVAQGIEQVTGVKIHGLIGTDFLKTYNYTIDFKSLNIYN